MATLSVMMKPASGSCDLRCRYCFYADESRNRETENYGQMSEQTLEQVVKKTLQYATDGCTFGFQGGEPTLRGLEFFRRFVALEKKHNHRGVPVERAIQTNGIHLTQEWATFFRRNHFLVGLSLDGGEAIHDRNRVDAGGQGTFRRVMNAVELLRSNEVDFNILCVVTEQNAPHIEEIYRFFMEQGLVYQQYIACLDPLGSQRGSQPYSLTPQTYGDFLIRLFDLWFADRMAGKFVFNRYFENLAGLMLGRPNELCGMGACAPQLVVEADGSAYPCDFYMLDDYRLGSFQTDTVPDMAQVWNRSAFAREATMGLEACRSCPYGGLCRGGCRRDRQGVDLHRVGRNYFCPAYRRFFAHAIPRLQLMLSMQRG